MKNEELLADAIGGLDEELLISVNRKRGMEDTNKLVVVKNEPRTEKKRSVKKFWLPLTACPVLILSLAAAGAAALVRGLRVGETENGEKTVEYIPDSYDCVPLSELTGDVVNTPARMKQQLLLYLAGEPIPAEGTSSEDIITFNVTTPGALYQPFATIDAAEAYVGYSGIHMPRIAQSAVQLGVYASGATEGGLMSANEDSEFELMLVGIVAGYRVGEMCNAVSCAVIQLGDQYQSGPLVYMDSQDLTFAQETKVVGTREFSILRIEPEFEGGFTSVSVYWNENKVLYTLQLSYGAEDTAAAEALITEWMNAF